MDSESADFVLKPRSWETPETYPKSTRILMAKEIEKHGWEIGEHTYGKVQVFERMAHLKIGKYCSIAGGVGIALGNHRLDTVSSYPFAALKKYWRSVPRGAVDHVTRGAVEIGHDVWIGASAFIGSGVTVGNGAVIGAHAVVTKDVPPYAIVAGNPAKIIRHRFSTEVIAQLLSIAWWDWPDEKVDTFLPLMLSDNIDAFIRHAKAVP